VRARRWLMASLTGTAALLALALGAACMTSGCSTAAYLAQAVQGHLAIVKAAKPVDDWLADPSTPAALKARLALSQRMRDFAISELGLPDNSSYRRYADLDRPAAVWNVVAAPELSLTLETWCFPVVGCVGYRGYYSLAAAQAEAARQRALGLEVDVYPVPAYSTLGKTAWLGGDPLLSTFIAWPEGELARLIFHELSHQLAYAAGDTGFNESYATAVERLGGARWLAEHADAAARAQYQQLDARRTDMRALLARYRDLLTRLYGSDMDDTLKRRDKAALMVRLQADYQGMKSERWQGDAGYDGFMARINNAVLGVQAAYQQRVPAFEALFEREGRDWWRFHAEVRRLAALSQAERDAAIAQLTPAGSGH
jgi:predicted aminopeptidase